MEGFRHFARTHPQLTMSALWQVPVTHPLISQGVSVPNVGDLPVPGAEDEDAELDVMIDQIYLDTHGPNHPYVLARQANNA
jgi:hypothetical protein